MLMLKVSPNLVLLNSSVTITKQQTTPLYALRMTFGLQLNFTIFQSFPIVHGTLIIFQFISIVCSHS